MRQKKGFWSRRLENLKLSFTSHKPSDWLKSSLIDLAFFIIFCLVLVIMIGTVAHNLKGIDEVASKAITMIPSMQSGMQSEQTSQRISEIQEEFRNFLMDLLKILSIYLVLFGILISSWNFIALSIVNKVKMRFVRWIRFNIAGVLWFIFSFTLIIFTAKIITNITAAIIAVLLLVLVLIYFSTILFYALLTKKRFKTIGNSLLIGLKKMHTIGFAFLVCVLTLVIFNLAFYTIDPLFASTTGLISLALFILFFTWSRFYMCLELEEVIDAKND